MERAGYPAAYGAYPVGNLLTRPTVVTMRIDSRTAATFVEGDLLVEAEVCVHLVSKTGARSPGRWSSVIRERFGLDGGIVINAEVEPAARMVIAGQ